MGAQVKLDLTSDVTHLIVGNTNSAKYRYVAKAREDVKVLFPEWIHAVQKVWMEGEDAITSELEGQWRLPTFYGLKICLTGFDNPEQRKYIQETVTRNGAEYHGDLTKAVTHLIAANPSGSKYEHAVNWRMKIVTWEWFEQSRERGMALDEVYYHPTMAVEERGLGAWDRRRSTSPMLGKRMRSAEQAEPVLNPSRRKLRRAASTRLSGQTEALWAGITAGGVEKRPNDGDDWTEDNGAEPEPQPEHEPSATTVVETRVDMQPRKGRASRPRGPFSDDNDGIFAGRVVYLRGFDHNKTNILREHLDSNGAVVICDAAELENFASDDLGEGFVLVPHDVQPDLTSLPEAAGAMSVVTNWWVERCLHGKCLVDPTDYVLCKPFDKLSISGLQGLTINSTGFAGIELLHVTKAVALFGAETICRNDKPNPEKVSEIYPFDAYLLNTNTSQPQKPRQRQNESSNKDVPTAPLSKEDSIKFQQKEAQKAKPASDFRSNSRRPGALELSASGPPTPSTTGSSTNLNTNDIQSKQSSLRFEQDAQLPGIYDGTASIPLQDVDPSVNSPRKPSTSSTDSTTFPKPADPPTKPAPAQRSTRPVRQPSPDSVIPPDTEPPIETLSEAPIAQPPEKDYSDIMSKLLATRKTSAPVDKEDETGRRRRRPLGRAQSGRSNTSTTDDVFSRQSSASKVVEEEEMGEEDGHVLDAFKPPEPSQLLGWDSPGAQRAREKMIRAIGGNVTSESPIIQETRVVKDACTIIITS
ncbi:protein kinase activating protein dpb11 [Didymosphaeria variabile]|uniref:Protein kinase activating protein dpb11 n=1 Tax=Didymosphaeria variabile TaxID=1932322 RepID=A0A9W8XP04_9PLEO|nr:protein kinase activating protein dpb11 [Didymosphaeria variabile]KAJ4355562.1 protein kinase activating protein dpb11 [Didymosphaeria variabile]